MPASAARLGRTGKYPKLRQVSPGVVRPASLRELVDCLDPASRLERPIRPMGAGTASTDCNTASNGTVIDMTGMNRVVNIDAYNDTVTVQAGVRIGELAVRLAEQGLELPGSQEIMERTIGGAIAGGSVGPSISDDGAFFATQVIAMKVVTPGGGVMQLDKDHQLLRAFRLSYGMLGIIAEVTLKVRPERGFVATHRRCTIKQFAAATESLAKIDVGLKFFLLPFRDRVYLDLRRYSPEVRAVRKLPWRLKDWGESTVLPQVFRSINRIVPVAGVRYRLMDEISQATQGLVNNALVKTGTQAATGGNACIDGVRYSTWLFPAADFAIVVQAYVDFCKRIREEEGFRCDMPTVGYRLSCDRSALLSPSFDEPMFALRAVTTEVQGWENFTIDLASFAEHWGGMPFFDQTRGLSSDHAFAVFGDRIEAFRKVRRQIDPDGRMMNPFLSQYFL